MAITGQFVSQVALADSPPVNCTVQQWVEGEPPHGHFTADQVRRIGALMATLHEHSTGYPLPPRGAALRQDAAALARNVGILRTALDTALLSDREYAALVAAQKHITALMASLGTAPEPWGPVHGDLHHDNLLFFQQEIRPIDFTGLQLAHYAYDIGVTLYHIYYQAPASRHAFFEGYQQVRRLSAAYPRAVETFVAYAAIDNIAWNSTIPAQAHSALFQRNLRQLIATFCANLTAGHPFLFS
jgi:Ser/Thr protein kinase RdoA (MazF antagonist)